MTNPNNTALRLALHIGGYDHLLPSGDYGDDLYDSGLMRDEDTEDRTYAVATPAGETLLKQAVGAMTPEVSER